MVRVLADAWRYFLMCECIATRLALVAEGSQLVGWWGCGPIGASQ